MSKKYHIQTANIDQAFLIVTIDNPKTSLGFIDRFLVTTEAYHIPTIIIFNKMDTYNSEHLEELNNYKKIYESIGYKTLEVSAITGLNIDLLKEKFIHSTLFFSVNSAIEKWTLLNALILE